MSIQTTFRRAKHDKENPFVMISKKMFRDPNISLKAKGLLGYLLCLPDDWQVNPKQIASVLQIGHDQIYSALKELISHGYCRRLDEIDLSKRFSRRIYEFSEEKIYSQSGNPDPGFPDTENPYRENPDPENGHITDTYNTHTENKDTYSSELAKPASKPKKDFYYSHENNQFEEISSEDLKLFESIYKNIDVSLEISKAANWLKANPSKANKKLWRKYLTGWLERAEDKAHNKKAWSSSKNPENPKGLSYADLNKEKTLKEFKNGHTYMGATFYCGVNDSSLNFHRGCDNILSFKEAGFNEKLEHILWKLGIK
jgi:hypothetical protein